MKKLILAVITSAILSTAAHAGAISSLGDAGAASAKFQIAHALDQVDAVTGKTHNPMASFTYADKMTKKLDKLIVKGIRAKTSCLKIKSDWVKEQSDLVKAESNDDELLAKASLKVIDAAGDYIGSQCLSLTH